MEWLPRMNGHRQFLWILLSMHSRSQKLYQQTKTPATNTNLSSYLKTYTNCKKFLNMLVQFVSMWNVHLRCMSSLNSTLTGGFLLYAQSIMPLTTLCQNLWFESMRDRKHFGDECFRSYPSREAAQLVFCRRKTDFYTSVPITESWPLRIIVTCEHYYGLKINSTVMRRSNICGFGCE